MDDLEYLAVDRINTANNSISNRFITASSNLKFIIMPPPGALHALSTTLRTSSGVSALPAAAAAAIEKRSGKPKFFFFWYFFFYNFWHKSYKSICNGPVTDRRYFF